MLFSGRMNGFLGAKCAATKTPRLLTVAERLVENRTVAITCHSWFERYQFKKCEFLWVERSAGWKAEIFVGCQFYHCQLGMPTADFLTFTRDSVVNVARRLTRQEVLDQVARRYFQQNRAVAVCCLDPCCAAERQQLVNWVRAEYRRILDDAGLQKETAQQ